MQLGLVLNNKNLKPMVTNDFSREAYEGILIEAEKLTHDLTLHYGLLASDCNNEADYLDKAENLSKEIKQVEAWGPTICFGEILRI